MPLDLRDDHCSLVLIADGFLLAVFCFVTVQVRFPFLQSCGELGLPFAGNLELRSVLLQISDLEWFSG